MKSVLIDIDNVLANSTWRENLISEQGWDAFHSASIDDKAIESTCQIVSALSAVNFNIVLLTGRTEKFRQTTLSWLFKNGIFLDDLIMRPDDDFRKSPIMKVALVKSYFHDLNDIAFIIDDRIDIIEAFQAEGIPGFQAFVAHVRNT